MSAPHRATETNGTAESEGSERRESRNGSDRARTAGHEVFFERRLTRDGGIVNNNDDAAAGAGRRRATLGNSLFAGPPSRSPSLSLTATIGTTTTTTTTREVNGPGPLDVEGKNGEGGGESRVSFPWCVMGCFGSQSSKASQDDSKNQKRRSDAITRQLQKDKQVYRATHRLLLLGKFQQR